MRISRIAPLRKYSSARGDVQNARSEPPTSRPRGNMLHRDGTDWTGPRGRPSLSTTERPGMPRANPNDERLARRYSRNVAESCESSFAGQRFMQSRIYVTIDGTVTL